MAYELLFFGLALLGAARFNWWQASRIVGLSGRDRAVKSRFQTIDSETQKVVQFLLWLSAFCTSFGSWLVVVGIHAKPITQPGLELLLGLLLIGLFCLIFAFPLWFIYRWMLYRALAQKLGGLPFFAPDSQPKRPRSRRRRSRSQQSDQYDTHVFSSLNTDNGGASSDGSSWSFGGESGGSDFGGGESGGEGAGGDW